MTVSAPRCAILQNRGGWREDQMVGRCTFPIGPWNTYSNAAYLLVAGALVARNTAMATLVMAGALTVLAIGSALYHGFKTGFTNRLDWVGMYCVFGALSVHGMAPQHPLTPVLMAITGVALAILFSYVLNPISLEVQMGLLFWFSGLAVALRGHWSLVIVAVSLFVLAYGFQVADRKGWTGRWGHALWHVLTALGIAFLFVGQE